MADKPFAATAGVTRAGTLISDLNIINLRTRDEFFDKWKFMPYIEIQELAKAEEKVDNKEYYHYESVRPMGFVTANATVVAANGAAAVITLAAGSYAASGTRSLPEIGKIFQNNRTGIEGRVTATNKDTANAHTATFVPVVEGQSFGVTAGDELLDRGFKYVGEASTYTGTTVTPHEVFTNYCTQIRVDRKFTDLALAEAVDINFNGQKFYKYKQLAEDNYRFRIHKELLLMDSQLTTNLGYTESGSKGIIQQVEANGITETYSGSFSALAVFASMERKFDSQGAAAEFDILSDTEQNIAIQSAIGQEFSNGAIVYDRTDLKYGFKTMEIMNRKYNFMRYLGFTPTALYGTATNGIRSNFGLVLPKGNATDSKTRNKRPYLQIKYQEIEGQKVVITEWGALSKNGKTPEMILGVGQEAHMSADLFGANGAMILKGS